MYVHFRRRRYIIVALALVDGMVVMTVVGAYGMTLLDAWI